MNPNDGDDFQGTRGNDVLTGGPGDDTFRGRGGDDTVMGRGGDDTAIFNVTNDGSDTVDLGQGDDVVVVNKATAGQVRLTFTSSEVGNGIATDSNTMMNQDGGLAVRLQAEDGSDGLTGPISRFDDEGITFETNTPGVTFDVRDLVTGAQRGNQFEVVELGTSGGDRINEGGETRSYYINAGMGDDSVIGTDANDFLVGGAGNDRLSGFLGNDTFIGGSGKDALFGGMGADVFIFNAPLDESANIDTIKGFSVADDTIRLENDVFTGLTEGPLDPEAFAFVSDANEADDRILYNEVTGRLLFDQDGGDSSNAIVFAQLMNQPNGISAEDFVVI